MQRIPWWMRHLSPSLPGLLYVALAVIGVLMVVVIPAIFYLMSLFA